MRALALGLVAASGFAAAAPTYVLQADHRAGPVVLARSTLPQASAALGRPGVVRRHGSTCSASWRALGLAAQFVVIGADPRDPCKAGVGVVVTLTSRARWRTARGLRVGDAAARARRLYPRAVRHGSSLWLVTRHACSEVGGTAYPGLLARLRAGRVAALVATAGICD